MGPKWFSACRWRCSTNKQIRILLAEDHEVMRAALRSLLDAREDLMVVGEADNGREMMGLIEKTEPDVVVMDIKYA